MFTWFVAPINHYFEIHVCCRLVEECVPCSDCDPITDNFGYLPDVLCQRALKILVTVAQAYPASFHSERILTHLMAFFKYAKFVSPFILHVLRHVGHYKPIAESNQFIFEKIMPMCSQLSINGTPKQAKHAVLCLAANIRSGHDNKPIDVFTRILHATAYTQIQDKNFRTVLVTMGHIAQCFPKNYRMDLKHLITQRIIKELLVYVPESKPDGLKKNTVWCTEERLPKDTRCKMEGFKTLARWLIGTRNDLISAQKTFRMLYAFIKKRGDVMDTGKLAPAEMAWLRLSAGKAMLKICEQKGAGAVGGQMTTDQLFILSELMVSNNSN